MGSSAPLRQWIQAARGGNGVQQVEADKAMEAEPGTGWFTVAAEANPRQLGQV